MEKLLQKPSNRHHQIIVTLRLFSTDALPTEFQLMSAMESFYQLQLESELAEFEVTQKMKWLKYLPTVGVTYTLDGKPRPAVSWSSNLLYANQKDKAQVFAKNNLFTKNINSLLVLKKSF